MVYAKKDLSKITNSKLKITLDYFLDGILPSLSAILDKVILFGSYARGDFTKDSDIDLLLIFNIPEKNLTSKECDCIDDITGKIISDLEELISPVFVYKERYEKNLNCNPLFINIHNEGVVVYG